MSDPVVTEKSIAELVDLGRITGDPKVAAGGNVPYAVIPSNCKVEDLSRLIFNDHAERPERKNGTVTVLDGVSFCEYYTLFSDENSRTFADETKSRILAVLDYHEAHDAGPRWGRHRLDLPLRYSPEWTAWKAKDAKNQTQVEFAEFIEDNTPDIVSPDAATMREIALDLSAKSDVNFASGIRLANGQVQLAYNETIVGTFGKGQMEIPERFTISIPVHVGAERVEMTVRLRYRINSGRLAFSYHLFRPEAVERAAFVSVRQSIEQALQIRIINGTPA